MMEIDGNSFRNFLKYLETQYQNTNGRPATARLQELDEQLAKYLAARNLHVLEVYLDGTRIGIIGRWRGFGRFPSITETSDTYIYTYEGTVPGYHNRGSGNSEVGLEFIVGRTPPSSHRKDLHDIPFP